MFNDDIKNALATLNGLSRTWTLMCEWTFFYDYEWRFVVFYLPEAWKKKQSEIGDLPRF